MHIQSNKQAIQQSSQPRGFSIFFLTEMWERYGFYVIQTLLVFFLTDQLHLDDEKSYIMVGSFTALSYINCIFGGIVADKLIGSSRGVFLGGILLTVGYTFLGYKQYSLDIALAIIATGNGLLKPNISSLLGMLYNNEAKKENGYTIYYVGLYFGAISGSFIGGYLQKHFGWTFAFMSAAVGGLLSILIFTGGVLKYKLVDKRHNKVTFKNYLLTLASIISLIWMSYLVLHSNALGLIYFILVGLFCLLYLLCCIIRHHGIQRNRLIAFLILILLSVFYWGVYFQQFFSLSLCISRVCDLSVSASIFPAIESLGIILFGPVVTKVWSYFQSRGSSILIPARFGIGFLFNALGFIVMCAGLKYASLAYNYMSQIIIIISYLLISIGELSLSPTSLSMVTTLVPKRFVSAMMGIVLLSIGFGGKLAGILAQDAKVAENNSLHIIQINYMRAFLNYFMISIVALIVVLTLRKYLNTLIKV